MTKLRPARAQEVQRVLEQLGFKRRRQRGSRAVYRHGVGRYTTGPMHRRDLPLGTLRQILKDIGLAPEEFERLR